MRFLLLFLLSACAHQPKDPCADASKDLARLDDEDQADRVGEWAKIDWNAVSSRDLARREEVAKIFARGCFRTGEDYAHASMVYQHGTVPDHYLQTFLWARRGAELGSNHAKGNIAVSIDRYLVAIGHRQLFGTQLTTGADKKYCYQPIEPSFPESRRKGYTLPLREYLAMVLKMSGARQTVEETKVCETKLAPSPAGTVPAFW